MFNLPGIIFYFNNNLIFVFSSVSLLNNNFLDVILWFQCSLLLFFFFPLMKLIHSELLILILLLIGNRISGNFFSKKVIGVICFLKSCVSKGISSLLSHNKTSFIWLNKFFSQTFSPQDSANSGPLYLGIEYYSTVENSGAGLSSFPCW